MDAMLRRALRKHSDLRHQLEAMLLGDDGDEVERQLRSFVAKRPCWVPAEVKTNKAANKKAADLYSIVVDYALTLEQRITAGRYDWENDDINAKNFPIKGEGQVELKPQLIHFDRNISSDAAEAELDKLGLRPANLEELLAFGAKYPDLQRDFPIIGLKAEALVDGGRYMACLDRGGSGCKLRLGWRDYDWDGYCRFLALAK